VDLGPLRRAAIQAAPLNSTSAPHPADRERNHEPADIVIVATKPVVWNFVPNPMGGSCGRPTFANPQSWIQTARSRLASGLVHPSALVPDLDCLPALNVAYKPSRFEHNPRLRVRRVSPAALRYLHAADEHENVAVFILVNLVNRSSFVTHLLHSIRSASPTSRL
jgi:hypothetical protein